MSFSRGNVLPVLCPKGMCDCKNSWFEAKTGVKATSIGGG